MAYLVSKTRPTCNRPHKAVIDILNDHLLLDIFHLCRPVLLEGEADDPHHLEEGKWVHERWWYKLVHVCQRWRYLVLASASNLHLFLVCTYGTPVADMLAQSPLLPLIIDYNDQDRNISVEDEEGILVALHHRQRICRIRLWIPASNLRKLVAAMGGEFPILGYLFIKPRTNDDKSLILPETFQAPHLRQLVLRDPGIFHPPSPTPRIQFAERIGQCISNFMSQHWRYAPFYYISSSVWVNTTSSH